MLRSLLPSGDPTAGFGPACRYGDHSASNFFNGRRYFATEDAHALTNVAAGGYARPEFAHADAFLDTPELSRFH